MNHLIGGRLFANDPLAARLNLLQTSFRNTTQPNQTGELKMTTQTQAPLPGVTPAAATTTTPKPTKGVLSKIKDSGNGKDPSAAEKKLVAKKSAKNVAAKATAKKVTAKKPAAKTAKRSRVAADTKFTVAKNNARDGTDMHAFMAIAEGLKKFTRDELVNAAKRKLGNEQRARAYFSWSLGHELFKAA